MRLRFGLWALLISVGSMIAGCGKAESPEPPPGVETDIPNLEIDEGSIAAPDEAPADKDADQDAP